VPLSRSKNERVVTAHSKFPGPKPRAPVIRDPGSIVQKLTEDVLLETGTRVAARDFAELDLLPRSERCPCLTVNRDIAEIAEGPLPEVVLLPRIELEFVNFAVGVASPAFELQAFDQRFFCLPDEKPLVSGEIIRECAGYRMDFATGYPGPRVRALGHCGSHISYLPTVSLHPEYQATALKDCRKDVLIS